MARSGDKQEARSRPGRPRRDAGPTLSRSRVAEEALRLVDEEGVAALTMRRLADRLGIEAMSLYTHVSGKDDLLDAVADRVANEMVLQPAPELDWQERIRRAVAAWAGMEKAHPNAFPLIYRSRTDTETERAVNEEIMDALAASGLDPAEVALAYQTLISFLDGALIHWPRSRWRPASNWDWVSSHVDANRYPRLVDIARHAAQLQWEEVFYTGLELLLRGLSDSEALQRRGEQ